MASHPYFIPYQQVRSEVEHLRSRFIATVSSASETEEARQFIKKIKKEFPDASHHVPAYIIGGGKNRIDYCSDDGEPSGTSGRPVLTVLQGSGLGDVVVVVIRYFGGTLLGTGGLVKAYTDATQRVLERVEKAIWGQLDLCSVTIPYPYYERVKILLAKAECSNLQEVFSEEVTISFEIAADRLEAFRNTRTEMTAARVKVEVIGHAVRKVPVR